MTGCLSHLVDCSNATLHRCADGLDSDILSSQSTLSNVCESPARDDALLNRIPGEPAYKVAFRDLA